MNNETLNWLEGALSEGEYKAAEEELQENKVFSVAAGVPTSHDEFNAWSYIFVYEIPSEVEADGQYLVRWDSVHDERLHLITEDEISSKVVEQGATWLVDWYDYARNEHDLDHDEAYEVITDELEYVYTPERVVGEKVPQPKMDVSEAIEEELRR